MMFGRVTASEGAAQISADCTLFAIEQWGAGEAGETFAAFVTAYVAIRAPDFGVPEEKALGLSDAGWRTLLMASARFRFRSPAFIAKFSAAERLLRTSDKPNAAFLEAMKGSLPIEVGHEDHLSWLRSTRDSIDEMLRIKSVGWITGR